MTITYTNRKQKLFTLYQKPNKKGNLRYYFSQKPSEGTTPVDVIPAGYEIYENVNGQVFLRKHKPSPILESEYKIVGKAMQEFSLVKRFRLDTKGKQIVVYTPVEDVDLILETFEELIYSQDQIDAFLRHIRWRDVMRFELVDSTLRLFQTQRYCFLGGIDDWIDIGEVGRLKELAQAYVPHIEQESYFTLM